MGVWDILDNDSRGIIQMTTANWKGKRNLLNSEHILHSLLSVKSRMAIRVLEHYGIDYQEIMEKIEAGDFVADFFPSDKKQMKIIQVMFDVSIGDIISVAYQFVTRNGHNNKLISSDHLFLAMCTAETAKLHVFLERMGVSSNIVQEYIVKNFMTGNLEDSVDDINPDDDDSVVDRGSNSSNAGVDTMDPEDYEREKTKENISRMKNNDPQKTPTLDTFGTNMVEMARKGEISTVIGRDKETEMLIEILCRKNKRNALLIGEPGVGKTAVVEGLALALLNQRVPLKLKGKKLVQLDSAGLVSGTVFRGQFEQRMKTLVEELVNSKNTIVFIDEMHTIMGAGNGAGGADIGNILKPELARGTIQVIGATTQDEYRKYIQKDGALERRFQTIEINEPSAEDAQEILRGLRESFENYHDVQIEESAIKAAVRMSRQYVPGKFLPDKCIDLIDIACARPQIKTMAVPPEIEEMRIKIENTRRKKDSAARDGNTKLSARMYREETALQAELDRMEERYYSSLEKTREKITEENIADVVSRLTGIPAHKITESDAEKLLSLEERIKEKLLGQDEAVSAVCRAVRRSRSGLHDGRRPIGSFLFAGPTGVGKTELARQLTAELFGREDALIKLDMSEYAERYDVTKMFGSGPSFVGYEDGGVLTNAIRKKPYSVVLFDEIEKAHPDVLSILLQILEDGVLKDGQGKTAFFNNSVVIMTSNIGAQKAFNFRGRFGFGEQENESSRNEEIRKIMRSESENYFRPEFLNRIDDIVLFNQLSRENILKIVDLELGRVNSRIAHRNMKIVISDSLRNLIATEGYNEKYGARPIRRTIQSRIEDYVAGKILRGEYVDGDTISLDFDGENKQVIDAE